MQYYCVQLFCPFEGFRYLSSSTHSTVPLLSCSVMLFLTKENLPLLLAVGLPSLPFRENLTRCVKMMQERRLNMQPCRLTSSL